MTTARHIVTLLKSHIDGDEDRFLATAMQLAAHEARQGSLVSAANQNRCLASSGFAIATLSRPSQG